MTNRLVLCLLLVGPIAAGQQPSNWRTDTSKRSIELNELKPGGPGKDGIPALTNPRFESAATAGKWLSSREPVVVVASGGEARVYPLQVLLWHELANDELDGVPILVSYCPLCNSAIVFDRRVGGKPYEFGVSGMLRDSDMVMFDRETESLWQQITGEAIVGVHTGRRLPVIPSQTVPFEIAAQQYPAAKVLSRNTGFKRQYGKNPYAGYEFGNQLMFPVRPHSLKGAKLLERIVTLGGETGSRAYSFSDLRKAPVVEGEWDGSRYVILYSEKGTSALDAERLAESRNVGAVGVFSPEIDGMSLRFKFHEGRFVDDQTGSTWNLLGGATAGPLAGKQLKPFPHAVAFAFAWLVFRPDTEIVRPAASPRRR